MNGRLRWVLAPALVLGGCNAIFGLSEGTLAGAGGSDGAGGRAATGAAPSGATTSAGGGGAAGSGGKATTSATTASAGGAAGAGGKATTSATTTSAGGAAGTGGKATTSATTASAGGGGAAGSTTTSTSSTTAATTGTGGHGGAGGGGATVASTATTTTASTTTGTGGAGGASTTTGTGGAGGASTTTGTGGAGGNACGAGGIPAPTLHASWPMPNPQATGLLPAASYDTSIAGIVGDNVTGLVWQEPPDPAQASIAWSDAQSYCHGLALAEHCDWRLPSIIELVSIIDSTVAAGLNEATFTASGGYWSSTPAVPGVQANSAWTALFGNAPHVYYFFKSGQFATRCVRAGKTAAGGYSAASGTVVDAATGLTWQQTVNGTIYAEVDAASYCTGNTPMLPAAPWRLPSINELLTLVDWTQHDPAINPVTFAGTPIGTWYWTSSMYLGGGAGAYLTADFSSGASNLSSMTGLVRCVH